MLNSILLLIGCYHHLGYRNTFEFNYTTSVVYHSRILVRASQAYLRSGTYILPILILNLLRDRFLFKFVLFHHILIGYIKISLCEQLKFHFFCTFVHFNIVIFTWHDFISYSTVLPMSISARLFHTLSIFRCIIYVTT